MLTRKWSICMAEQKRYSQYEEAWNQSEKRVNTELQLARGFQVADVYLNRIYLEKGNLDVAI